MTMEVIKMTEVVKSQFQMNLPIQHLSATYQMALSKEMLRSCLNPLRFEISDWYEIEKLTGSKDSAM